jgi:hypothetical protein
MGSGLGCEIGTGFASVDKGFGATFGFLATGVSVGTGGVVINEGFSSSTGDLVISSTTDASVSNNSKLLLFSIGHV